MSSQPINPVEVFYSYAHEDEKLCDELQKHLANLKRQGVVTGWYDRDISAGTEWDDEIEKHLNSAKVILLLISPDFMNSVYSNKVEMKRAMERHESGEARVIPIILRPVDWEGAPFSKLQGLPTDAKAITLWPNYDEAFFSVVKGIRSSLKELSNEPAAAASATVSPAKIPRPPVVGFVSRRDKQGRDIVERLKEELAPEGNQMIALSGPGGVGKTTIAAETARSLSKAFSRIVWISADGRDDFALSTLLDEIAKQLGRADVRLLIPEEKAEQVQAAIAAIQTLIIFDNFDTVVAVEQTRCAEFLFKGAPCPVLITTRQKIPTARTINILGMSPPEADDFLHRLITEWDDPSALSKVDRERTMAVSDCNPLVMQWVVAQIDLAQEASTVLDELTQGLGDAAKCVFDRSFGLEQVGDDGRAVLLALSLFAPDASRPTLAEVAGFGEDVKRLNEAVTRLASLWLTKTTSEGQRLSVEGLTRELAKARMLRDEHSALFSTRFATHFRYYAKRHSRDFEALDAERENLLNAMDVGSRIGDLVSVMTICSKLKNFFEQRDYPEDDIRSSEQALRAARDAKDESAISHFTHSLGILYRRQREFVMAKTLFSESLELSKRLGKQHGIASNLRHLGRVAQEEGNLSEALRLYNQSLEICKTNFNVGGIAATIRQLARLAHHEHRLGDALLLYNESLAFDRGARAWLGIAKTLHDLARLAHDQGDLDEARRLYDESLRIKKRLGNQRNIAITLRQLGMLAEDEGSYEKAEQLFSEALAIFEKLKSPYAEIARQSLERVKGKSS